jgi:hypothetical protein
MGFKNNCFTPAFLALRGAGLPGICHAQQMSASRFFLQGTTPVEK